MQGTGNTPAKGALIRCHYTGRLENGRVFDSSYERGRPLSFKIGVGEVIKVRAAPVLLPLGVACWVPDLIRPRRAGTCRSSGTETCPP